MTNLKPKYLVVIIIALSLYIANISWGDMRKWTSPAACSKKNMENAGFKKDSKLSGWLKYVFVLLRVEDKKNRR